MRTFPITHALLDRIDSAAPGTIFFPADFLDLGSAEAIHTTFSRLAAADQLTRLAKGIYLKPKTDPELGKLKPSLEDLAHKIADRDRVIIRPTGAYALNKLGLSTQVPTKVVFLTNGNAKRISVGNRHIIFKKVSPKQLAVKSDTVFLAIQALIELKDRANRQPVIDQLTAILSREAMEDILEGARLAPQQVGRILYLIAEKIKTGKHG